MTKKRELSIALDIPNTVSTPLVVNVSFKKYMEFDYRLNYRNITIQFAGKKVTAVAPGAQFHDYFIYIFRKAPSGEISLNAEIKVLNSANPYQYYNPSKRTKTNKIESSVELDVKQNGKNLIYYFTLSDFQLSGSRIDKISEQLKAGKSPRAKEIPIIPENKYNWSYEPPPDSDTFNIGNATVYLTDYYEYANKLHENYITYRNAYLDTVNKMMQDQDQMNKRYLADFVSSVCEEKDWWGYLKNGGKDLKSWLKDRQDSEAKEIKRYEDWAVKLCFWLRQEEFNAVISDHYFSAQEGYSHDDLIEKGETQLKNVIVRLYESRAGQLYIKEAYNTYKDIYNKEFQGIPEQNRKDKTLDFDTLYKKYSDRSPWAFALECGRRPSQVFFTIIENIQPLIVRVEGIQSITIIREIIYRRSQLFLPDYVHGGYSRRWLPIGEKVTVEIRLMKMDVQVEREWAKKLGDAKILKALKVLIEVLNIALAAYQLCTSKSKLDAFRNSIAMGSALLDMIAVFAAKRVGYVLGAISGILDAVTYGWSAVDNIAEGDYDAAIGYTTAAVGALTVAVGSAMLAAGIGTSATVVGLPVGVVILIAGLIVMLVGVIIAFFCDDSEIEQWLKHCLWGCNYGEHDLTKDWSEGSYKSWVGDLQKQVTVLHNILYHFELKSAYASSYNKALMSVITLDIMPRMINAFSKITINAYLVNANNNASFRLCENLVLDESNVQNKGEKDKAVQLRAYWYDPASSFDAATKQHVKAGGHTGYPAKWIKVNELRRNVSYVQQDSFNAYLDFHVELDIKGDGSYCKRQHCSTKIINDDDKTYEFQRYHKNGLLFPTP